MRKISTAKDVKKQTEEMPSYDKAMAELESIVEQMEAGGMSIDALTAKLQRAQILVQHCRQQLVRTEEELQRILTAG